MGYYKKTNRRQIWWPGSVCIIAS